MASLAQKLIFYTFFLLLLFSHLPPPSFRTLAFNTNKVSLSLYYESLSPFSANFIINDLANLIQDHSLLSIVDLHLYPWGNAWLKSNNSFLCQGGPGAIGEVFHLCACGRGFESACLQNPEHGPYECLLNTVEACAIHVWPQLSDHFPFIYCIESLVYKRNYTEWKSCFQTLGLDPKPVTDCYSSGVGKKLELRYAAETDALVPTRKYVPWVVVDGQPLYENYGNFVSYICKAYDGTATPNACNDHSYSISARGGMLLMLLMLVMTSRICKSWRTRPNMPDGFKEMIMPKLIEQRTSAI